MSKTGTDASYFLARARRERELVESADCAIAAAVHRDLALRYSMKAFQIHAGDDDDLAVKPQSPIGSSFAREEGRVR